MTAAPGKDWRKDFGIEGREPPGFYSSQRDIDAAGSAAPQPHALRRAFEQLKLDGILCQGTVPLMYFRRVQQINPSEVAHLHRLFWNQGVAPILVLIAPDQVHVYSSLVEPTLGRPSPDQPNGFVEKLGRIADELQRFIVAVESGEYFRTHRNSFDPRQRVDRNLLRNLRAARQRLGDVLAPNLAPHALDALLCRLVFTCYLFDREVIDRDYLEDINIQGADHLRDILGRKPRSDAKADLYRLFAQLGKDFNGDLFSDDLDAEGRQIKADHLDILDRFFHATDVQSGQQVFWPYDFGIIPIETISAIYEHFLKAAGQKKKKEAGAFYTPRFLAELVLDVTLAGVSSLLDKRFLDPACGSGIFLVGLFNRLAEEWKLANPAARYDRRATGLMRLLTENLYGIDSNPTACRITAFSLCLAFLDQLSPPDIRQLRSKGKVLPYLVRSSHASGNQGGTITCADFFTEQAAPPQKVHFVIGNPPWAAVKSTNAPAALWSRRRNVPLPGRQIATAFMRKAPDHLEHNGKVCFVLPHGILFNHNPTAVAFQQGYLRRHAVELVLNLADYQRFLFEEAEAPAVVMRYTKEPPANSGHRIDYWAPKTDWAVTQAEVLTVLPQDRSQLTVREVLDDLKGDDAPLIWKERYWATPRDRRLLQRLLLYPRLRDAIGQRSRPDGKRWLIAEGFEPFGANDPQTSLRHLRLPSTARVEAGSHELDLFLLPDDCDIPKTLEIDTRRAISNPVIFKGPLVLVTEGFSDVAFADFDVAYRHGIRGIRGPKADRNLLIFLTVYLRSSLARFFLFHTSASWGISRARIDVDDLLRLPFAFPDETTDAARSEFIVDEIAGIMANAMSHAARTPAGRDEIVSLAQAEAEKLVDKYFDIDDIERLVIADTDRVIIPSARPTRSRIDVPTIRPATADQRAEYTRLLCATLNGWANQAYQVHGKESADAFLGVGMVLLEKTHRRQPPSHLDQLPTSVLSALHRLQRGAAKGYGTLELLRGLKTFDKTLLYITKPLGQRFWTQTAALNDADEIAATILMDLVREEA